MPKRQNTPQRRLLRLATWAQGMAWVVFILNLLWAWVEFEAFKHAVALRHLGISLSWFELLREESWHTLSALIGVFYRALQGVLFALILQSVAAGLKIIAALHAQSVPIRKEEP